MTPPVTHSVDPGGVGWIVFDDPGGRANVFNGATQEAFASALDALAPPAARAIVIASAKERIFIAGADLRWLAALPDVDSAAEFSRTGQELFQRLAASPVPVVCAIHGACAGGGYELALACHWRVASDAPSTRIGLPEVGVGTICGWGGCVRLPRLVGAQAALEHILKARLLPAAEALRAGLVDELVPAGELRARAREAALRLAGGGPPARPEPAAPQAGFFSGLRETTWKKTGGHLPAPLAVINVVEKGVGLSVELALATEARAFGHVTAGAACKNLVHGFFLREAAKKRTLEGWFPAHSRGPAPVRRVGIVGAGVMGSGIAQLAAACGLDVVLRDVGPQLVERGLGVVQGLFEDAVRHGAMSQAEAREARGRITGTTGWEGFAQCDLVIEAVVEDITVKKALFAELSGIIGPGTLLASNTSALPIEEIAGRVPHPGRTLGIHFFNPVGRMALVELVIGRDTSAEAAERALSFVKALGKLPVVCRSSPGFIVTRVLFFYLNEAVSLWEKGVPAAALEGAMRDFGWPMGPLRLIDEVGIDVTDCIFSEMARYFPQRFVASGACRALLAAGLRGRKSGAGTGFYAYGGGEVLNEGAARALARPAGGPALGPKEITARLMGLMVAEARRCLDEGVVRSPDDIDFATLAGAGFPAFRGGLMRYANRTGGSSPPM